MNRLSRIILFLTGLIGMVTSFGAFFILVPLGEISIFVSGLYEKLPELNYYFAGFTALIFIEFLVILILAFTYPRKTNFILYKKATGEIKISKQAINAMILSSISDLVNTDNIRLKVIYRKNTIKRIKITVYNRFLEKIPTLSEDIQNRVKEAVEKIMEIPSGTVGVLISHKELRRRKEKRVV